MHHKYMQSAASWLTALFPALIVIGSAASDIGMSTIAVLFLAHSFLKKDWTWTRENWVRCLFLLWLYMLVRGLFAENIYEALRRSLPFVRYFVFAAALAYWTLRDNRVMKRFQLVLTATVLLLAADGLLQRVIGVDIILHDTLHSPDGSLRLTGLFSNPILGIMIAWLSFPVYMRFVMNEEGKLKAGIGGILAILLMLAATAFSGERMALLLTFLGWLIALLLMPVRKSGLFLMFCTGVVLVGGLAAVNHELFERQIMSTVNTLNHWQDSPYGKLLDSDMKAAEINPVFGIGANHFRIVCPRFYPGYSEQQLSMVCNIHPHNIYLEWLIEQGIIGLLLFLAFIGLAVSKPIQAWRHQRANPYFIGSVIAFLIRLWPLASTTTFFSPFGAPPFWMIAGLLFLYE